MQMHLDIEEPIRQRGDLAAAVAAASAFLEQHARKSAPFLTELRARWQLARRTGDWITLSIGDDEIALTPSTWLTDDMFHPAGREIRVLQAFGAFLREKSDRQMARVREAVRSLDEEPANAQ